MLEIVGNVFTNMPPRREGYVRRAVLEAELIDVLQDSRHPVVTLQGRGGVGKTSLALTVLHDVALDGECFAIVWFSARDIDLLSEGPRVVSADVLATEDVARDSDLRKLPSDGGGELRLRQRAGLRKGFNCGRPGLRPQVIIGTLGRACRGSSARPRVAHAERSPNLLSEA